MNGGSIQEWVFWVSGGVLAFAGVLLAAWALFWDRSRGRRRCPKCWYDMTAAISGTPEAGARFTCPECGKGTSAERGLLRTRRRWRWATLAVFVGLLGAAMPLVGKAVRDGPWSLISTKLLVELVPIGGYDGPFAQQLLRRMGRVAPNSWRITTPLPEQDRIAIVRRLGKGNLLARQGTDRWRNSYGRIILETRTVVFTFRRPGRVGEPNPDLELTNELKAWYDIPLELSFRTRPKWPEGLNLWVDVKAQNYWPFMTGLDLKIRRAGGEGEFREINDHQGFPCREREKGTGTLVFEAQLAMVRQGESIANPSEVLQDIQLPPRQLDVPFVIEGTIQDILTPVESKELDAQLAGRLKYEVGPGWVRFNRWDCHGGPFEGLAFGVVIEFSLDGVLMVKERLWWDGSSPTGDPLAAGSDWAWQNSDAPGFKHPWNATPDEHWTAVMHDDPEAALRVIDRSRYWKGSITIPFGAKSR